MRNPACKSKMNFVWSAQVCAGSDLFRTEVIGSCAMGEVHDEKLPPQECRRCSAGEEGGWDLYECWCANGEPAAIVASVNASLAISHWDMFNKLIFPRAGASLPRARHQSWAWEHATRADMWPLRDRFYTPFFSFFFLIPFHSSYTVTHRCLVCQFRAWGGVYFRMVCASGFSFFLRRMNFISSPGYSRTSGSQEATGWKGVKSKSCGFSLPNSWRHEQV